MSLELLRDERQRQITEEGFTAAKDKKQKAGQLRVAAIYYMAVNTYPRLETSWPFLIPPKPDSDKINLIKAGALLMAERERLVSLSDTPADFAEVGPYGEQNYLDFIRYEDSSHNAFSGKYLNLTQYALAYVGVYIDREDEVYFDVWEMNWKVADPSEPINVISNLSRAIAIIAFIVSKL